MLRYAAVLVLLVLVAVGSVGAQDKDKPFIPADFEGWEGLIKEHWSVQDGALIGTTGEKGIKFNTFLCSKKKYKDFELSFQVKLEKGAGNSGVQIRSKLVDTKQYPVSGPQADIGQGFWGSLYGERFGGMMQQAPKETQKVIKPADFNEYVIRCVGKQVTITINGTTMIDGEFPTMPDEGIIAFQLHAGPSMKVIFKDIHFKDLSK
ncbi:MAG: DUF1080 domain-containing protein [Gemmataceae bacterium]